MTVIELAKLLGTHAAQGRGNYTVAVFQWAHGSQLVTEMHLREGCLTLELYSGTTQAPENVDDTSDLV
jgi:hypothetical protein